MPDRFHFVLIYEDGRRKAHSILASSECAARAHVLNLPGVCSAYIPGR